MPKPLPPELPAPPPDERLVAALSADTGIAAALVRAWLAGACAPGHLREPLTEALWCVLGGVHGSLPVRRVDATEAGVARKGLTCLDGRAGASDHDAGRLLLGGGAFDALAHEAGQHTQADRVGSYCTVGDSNRSHGSAAALGLADRDGSLDRRLAPIVARAADFGEVSR